MKILDRYILTQFLRTFVSSFFILMFIFIFQTIWIFIDELAGKGLDLVIVGKFLLYLIPDLTTKVVPLTVLLSSIMTFGSFAENYEFAAMKSSGFSLQRTMRIIAFFMVGLAISIFYFSNSIIPISQQKSYNLRKNIAKVKPSMAVVEGVFNHIEGTGMTIKVEDKYGDNDRFLKNIIIHKKGKGNDNTTVIKAKTGELRSSKDSEIIQLVLNDGHYYEDVKTNTKNKYKMPHAKANFDTYIMNMDLAGVNDVDMDEERDLKTHKMQSVSLLAQTIDTLKIKNRIVLETFSQSLKNRSGLKFLDKDIVLKDIDSLNTSTDIVSLYNGYQKNQIVENATNAISSILNSVKNKKKEIQRKTKLLNLHILQLHNKYALAFACVVLFFVGAPLGAIIRKGGLGLPMVIAIGLFLTYYFIGLFGKNYAENGNISPVLGSWLSTLIMLPLGIFLTKRATEDKGIVDFGIFTSAFKKIGGFLKKKK